MQLVGKTVLITGASAGLGFEASKHIARMKPGKLILGCRDMTKAEEAAKGRALGAASTTTL